LARLTEKQKQTAVEYLQMLISDGDEKKRKELSEEDVLRIYAAVKLASADNGREQTQSTQSTIVMNDFFKEKSRGFENSFTGLLLHQIKNGSLILYLSCLMPYPKKGIMGMVDKLNKSNPEDFRDFSLDFDIDAMR
jgi:hypothetical protein